MFPGNVIIQKTLPVTEYMKHYDTIDILLAPLEDNKMNRAKSSLKILECAAKNVLFIGSNLYKEKTDVLKHIYFENWYNTIKVFSEYPKEHFNKLAESYSAFNRDANPFQPAVTQKENLCKSIL